MYFLSPTRTGRAELLEKRSRFIALAEPVSSEDEARKILASVRAEHHSARHNVWCCILPDGEKRYSDDGEPSGSAGAPVAQMLEKRAIRGVICVVTRYFGGVLLGPGGLARAYTRAAQDAADDSALTRFVARLVTLTECSYAFLPILRDAVSRERGVIAGAQYAEDVLLTAIFEKERASSFIVRVRELSGGTVIPEITGETIIEA
ncbi:MAG: YigZ family protein [Oscillospiraceae bacterium]|jgi:uncharacterized YigZ family protein|nr:YigZ family protein [Oscillospiraceae bacterium]